MNTTLYVTDAECESCEKVLGRAFERIGAKARFDGIKVELTHEPSITIEQLFDVVRSRGYSATLTPPVPKRWHDHIGDLEKLLVRNVIVTLAALAILQGFVIGPLKGGAWLQQYGLWLGLVDIVAVSCVAALWHLRSYRGTVTCMTGMMLGMILGMQSGLLFGYIIGATNGFFLGALIASAIGIFFGYAAGNCCGTMGSVQGMMAGFMGGTMGPMIAVMLAASGFGLFTPWFFLVNIALLWTFSVLLMQHMGDKPHERIRLDFTTFAAYCIILAAAATLVIIFGPRGPGVI